MTNEQMDTLIEAELIMGEIDYDLDRWRRELDQYEYWLRVNEARTKKLPTWNEYAEVYKENMRPDIIVTEPREYPLAWYEDGTRFVVGKAFYNPETGHVDGVLDGAALRGLRIHDLLAAHPKDYSIKGTVDITNPNYPDYHVVNTEGDRIISGMRVEPGVSIGEIEQSWKEKNKRPFIEEFRKFGATWRGKRGNSRHQSPDDVLG